MFGFLKSKKPRADVKDPGAALQNILASTAAYKDVDPVFMGACLEFALRHFSKTGQFQGAYADLAQFKCMTMPDGIEVAGSEGKGASAVLAEQVMSVSQIAATPLHWSSVTVDTYLQAAVGQRPDWQVTDAGHVVATHAFTPEINVEFTAKPDDAIEPKWDGVRHSGATLMIHVKYAKPMGGMH